MPDPAEVVLLLEDEEGVARLQQRRLERAGYVRRGPFGDYSDDPLSVFMEKHLGG